MGQGRWVERRDRGGGWKGWDRGGGWKGGIGEVGGKGGTGEVGASNLGEHSYETH